MLFLIYVRNVQKKKKKEKLQKKTKSLKNYQKNTDFQIKQFESNAQPNYILLDSRKGNDKVLKPHVLQPARGYNKDRDAFVKFLQDGLKEYKARAGK